MPRVFHESDTHRRWLEPRGQSCSAGGCGPHTKSLSRVGKPALRASEEGIAALGGQSAGQYVSMLSLGHYSQVQGLMAAGIALSALRGLLDVTTSRGTDQTKAEKHAQDHVANQRLSRGLNSVYCFHSLTLSASLCQTGQTVQVTFTSETLT